MQSTSHYCSELSDAETLKITREYRRYREYLGRGMLSISLILFGIMVIYALAK